MKDKEQELYWSAVISGVRRFENETDPVKKYAVIDYLKSNYVLSVVRNVQVSDTTGSEQGDVADKQSTPNKDKEEGWKEWILDCINRQIQWHKNHITDKNLNLSKSRIDHYDGRLDLLEEIRDAIIAKDKEGIDVASDSKQREEMIKDLGCDYVVEESKLGHTKYTLRFGDWLIMITYSKIMTNNDGQQIPYDSVISVFNNKEIIYSNVSLFYTAVTLVKDLMISNKNDEPSVATEAQ